MYYSSVNATFLIKHARNAYTTNHTGVGEIKAQTKSFDAFFCFVFKFSNNTVMCYNFP